MEIAQTEKEKEPAMVASEELSREFKTLVNAQDLHSLKQLQLTMYFFVFFFECLLNFLQFRLSRHLIFTLLCSSLILSVFVVSVVVLAIVDACFTII